MTAHRARLWLLPRMGKGDKGGGGRGTRKGRAGTLEEDVVPAPSSERSERVDKHEVGSRRARSKKARARGAGGNKEKTDNPIADFAPVPLLPSNQARPRNTACQHCP